MEIRTQDGAALPAASWLSHWSGSESHQSKPERSEANFPPVLDACCGPRMMWYDPKDKRAIFVDKRCETICADHSDGQKEIVVAPDLVADFTQLPFPDETFALVVLDPPHVRRLEALGIITKLYGTLLPGWEDVLRDGLAECFRVLRPEGVLIFKWSSVEVPLARVLQLTDQKPLFGHHTGARAMTHWVCFLKHTGAVAPATQEYNEKGSERET